MVDGGLTPALHAAGRRVAYRRNSEETNLPLLTQALERRYHVAEHLRLRLPDYHVETDVERIPKEWAESVAAQVRAGREFQDAVREVLTANAELLILARKQQPKRRA